MVVTLHFVGFHPSMVLDGFEQLRLLKPIERIYILFDMKRDRYGAASRRNAKKLAKTLSFFRPVMVGLNPQSFGNVFSKLFALVSAEMEAGRKGFFIEVTDMPPEAVAAATTVALMFDDVSLYVVSTKEKGDFIPAPESPRFEDWLEEKDAKRGLAPVEVVLPGSQLRVLPSKQEDISDMVVLLLHEKGGVAGSIKDLINWYGEDATDPASKNRFSRLVDDLEDRGIVEKIHSGREREVHLTEFGKIYASALTRAREYKERVIRSSSLRRPVPRVVEQL